MRQGAADACRTSPMPPFNLEGSNARRHNFASTPSIREQVGFAVKSTRRQRDLLFADAEYHGHRRADDTDHQMTRSSEIDRQRNSRPNRYYQTNMGIRIPARRCDAVSSRGFSGRMEILRGLTKKQESFSHAPTDGMKPFLFIMAIRAALAYGGIGKCASAAHDGRESIR